jgi:hypothetical protein
MLLAEIDAQLTPGPGWAGPQVAGLCGLGGAGKTSVAIEHTYRHLAEAGVCRQPPAEEPAIFADLRSAFRWSSKLLIIG